MNQKQNVNFLMKQRSTKKMNAINRSRNILIDNCNLIQFDNIQRQQTKSKFIFSLTNRVERSRKKTASMTSMKKNFEYFTNFKIQRACELRVFKHENNCKLY